MNSQECRVRPETININSNEHLFYPYSIQATCNGNFNNINDPCAKLCVPMLLKTRMSKYSIYCPKLMKQRI